jgi:hypothetical protein
MVGPLGLALWLLLTLAGIAIFVKGRIALSSTSEVTGWNAYVCGALILAAIPVGVAVSVFTAGVLTAQGNNPYPYNEIGLPIKLGCAAFLLIVVTTAVFAFANAKPLGKDKNKNE